MSVTTRDDYYFMGDDSYDVAKKRDRSGEVNEYYKDDVMNLLRSTISKDRLQKAVKIDHKKNSSSIKYKFVTKRDYNDAKHIVTVSVPKKYAANSSYVKDLDALAMAGVHVKWINRAKALAVGIAFVLVTTGTAVAFVSGLDKELALQESQNKAYVDEINFNRSQNNMPPIDLVDEYGLPYSSWDEYFEDHPEVKESAEADYYERNPDEKAAHDLEQQLINANEEQSVGRSR